METQNIEYKESLANAFYMAGFIEAWAFKNHLF